MINQKLNQQVTKGRLLMHGGLLIFFVGSLVYMELELKQAVFMFLVFLFYDLMYLTNSIIRNMKPHTKKMNLVGTKVIITGGSSGIGFSLAKLFVKERCSKIVLVARNEDKLKKCVEEIKTSAEFPENQTVTYLAIDLSKDGVEVAKKFSKLGDIDVLVNCAGCSIPGEFQNLSVNDFETMMRVNYLGSVYATHAVIPKLMNKFGQVVFLSSVGGQLGVYGFSAYAPSKYALRGFAEVLQQELRPFDIGVSIAFPPDTETPGYENENENKPTLCRMISEQAGLWNPCDVAKTIRDGIVNRKFMIGVGSDGYFMNALTIGAAPSSSLVEFWLQLLLMPFLRIYMLFLQNFWTNMVTDVITKKININFQRTFKTA